MNESAHNQSDPARGTPAPGGDKLLWLIRLAAAGGLLICGYLLYVALTGQSAAGCGEGAAGCGHVLGTRWAKVLGLPVSGPAVGVYICILAASLHAGADRPQGERRWAWRILAIFGLAVGGAAVWFVGLQLLELGQVCPYCMAAHACSLLIACATLMRGPRLFALPGLALPAGLVALQLAFPPAVVGDEANLIGGLDTSEWPTLGDPDAPHVVGLLFDYNCGHCLHSHELLADAIDRYDGRLAVVLLPTAIDPRINPYVTNPAYVSTTTPELARLMLAVWLADPDQAAAFDRYLVEQVPRNRVDGIVPVRVIDTTFRAYAEQLVGEQALARAYDDPRIDERFDSAAEVYKRTPSPATGRPSVPRVILGGVPYGSFETAGQLDRALRRAYPDLIPADQ